MHSRTATYVLLQGQLRFRVAFSDLQWFTYTDKMFNRIRIPSDMRSTQMQVSCPELAKHWAVLQTWIVRMQVMSVPSNFPLQQYAVTGLS